jgi:hypothetical protein
MTRYIIQCPWCSAASEVDARAEDVERFRAGVSVQVALPYLQPAQRELFLSGICPSCWETLRDEED